MRDLDWIGMSDTQRGQLIAMWLLAADRKGTVPDDPVLIARLCFMTDVPDLEWFVQQGFMERDANVTPTRQPVDANVTPDRRQHDAPETEAEETRIEAEERTRARGLATVNGTGPPGLVGVIHRAFITKGKHLMLSEHQMEFVRALADRAGHEADPDDWTRRYLNTAWKLRQAGKDVWRGQPWQPSAVCGEKMQVRVVEAMEAPDAEVPEAVKRVAERMAQGGKW